jgi:hypoxanthine phosphoribosyltransferase
LPLVTDVNKISDSTLIIDDIKDGGSTMHRFYKENPTVASEHAVIYYDMLRAEMYIGKPPLCYAFKKKEKEWLQFPWETGQSTRTKTKMVL